MPRSNQPTAGPDLTALLAAAASGDREAFGRAYSLVYRELRRLARAQRRRWDGDDTLDTTALVHEAYLRLAAWNPEHWGGRTHFFAVAGRAMRQILVNYAERRRAAKRGGGRVVSLDAVADEFAPIAPEVADEVLALHEALERLERLDPRQCRIVECRFFAGLSIEETAGALGISPATVKRDWSLATAWLYRALADDDRGNAGARADQDGSGTDPGGGRTP
ncbi:MAG TPA: ECF-type sigma factor [Longimicrobiales bacterium]